ncbi:MAG: hypothetical protein ACP5E4_03755 [Candidatus Aenigmatarchaeota archaeon]
MGIEGDIVYKDGLIEVIFTKSAFSPACAHPGGPDRGRYTDHIPDIVRNSNCSYLQTNEPYAAKLYPKYARGETVAGIIGGGEPLLSFSMNEGVEKIVGIDINPSQVALAMAKINLAYGCPELSEAAGNLWSDGQNLKHTIERYSEGYLKYHGHKPIFECLKRRLEAGNLEITLIAGGFLEVIPLLEKNSDLYLSNLPDMVDIEPLEEATYRFLSNGNRIIACELCSDYYEGHVPEYMGRLESRGTKTEQIEAFTKGRGDTLNEIIYVASGMTA